MSVLTEDAAADRDRDDIIDAGDPTPSTPAAPILVSEGVGQPQHDVVLRAYLGGGALRRHQDEPLQALSEAMGGIRNRGTHTVSRQEMVLAAMAPAGGALHGPAQLQRMFLLIDRDIPAAVGGPYFYFGPSQDGPFDKAVYDTLDELETKGLAESVPELKWRSYRLTAAGQKRGEELLSSLPDGAQDYMRELSQFMLG